MIKSVSSVLIGIFLALLIGVLLIFGIAAPIFTRFFGPELASTALPVVFVGFAAAFAFYWGGMAASYRAPNHPRLHGVLVGALSFAISPLVNLSASLLSASGNDPFANLRTPGASLFTGVLFVVILAASYVGARRGETLYIQNQAYIRERRRRQETKQGP